MKFEIPIINKTMELSDCRSEWCFDEKHQVWSLEDVVYTEKATKPKFQRMSIFVPKEYMCAPGVVDADGERNGYTAKSAPVIFENNSAGYMQMPHIWLDGPRCYAHPYLKEGFVYVSCGNRGHDSKDEAGAYVGKCPANLIDLKTGIRFLRHNASVLPGDFDKLISVGWSAGGAMSTLLSLTGDNAIYEEYLRANGAFMEESDAVFAGQIYCPIVDLEHADMAYEWCFGADKENEASPAGPAGVMDAFAEALSEKLSHRYIGYFNSLGLKHPLSGEPLVLGEDKRSGSAYTYLIEKLSDAATVFLTKLQEKQLPQSYSVDDYLKGNYTYEVPAPAPAPDKADLMQGHAGPGVALHKEGLDNKQEPPTLGDMVSRPPKGMERPPFVPPMMEVSGKDKQDFLTWDGQRATISDLDSYVLQHRRRMKPCPSFDILSMESGENKVYGDAAVNAIHFSKEIAEAISELREEFPAEYETYYPLYAKGLDDAALERKKYLINPYNFVKDDGASKQARHFRIRVGASDADTSFMVSLALATMLFNDKKDVDFAYVWDQPHSEADYDGEVIEWIKSILG